MILSALLVLVAEASDVIPSDASGLVNAGAVATVIGVMWHLLRTTGPAKDRQFTAAIEALGKSHQAAVETLSSAFTAALDKVQSSNRSDCKEEITRLLQVIEARRAKD